jgi:hypothetical protein
MDKDSTAETVAVLPTKFVTMGVTPAFGGFGRDIARV